MDATAYGQWVPAASVWELWGKAAGHGARFLTVQGAGRLFQHSHWSFSKSSCSRVLGEQELECVKTGPWVLSLYIRNRAALGAAVAGDKCVAAPAKLLVIKASTATPWAYVRTLRGFQLNLYTFFFSRI